MWKKRLLLSHSWIYSRLNCKCSLIQKSAVKNKQTKKLHICKKNLINVESICKLLWDSGSFFFLYYLGDSCYSKHRSPLAPIPCSPSPQHCTGCGCPKRERSARRLQPYFSFPALKMIQPLQERVDLIQSKNYSRYLFHAALIRLFSLPKSVWASFCALHSY